MKPCLTRIASINALKKMSIFHKELISLYSNFNLDLLSNLGRRNIMLSNVQERFFADELAKTFSDVISDGRTGEPDIVIGELSKELECKLTSRQKSGAINFQTDYETLVKKSDLDYLYVIADEDFNKFAVLYFEGLTVRDFRSLSTGARGRVAMIKHRAMKKCTVLVGNASTRNEKNIEKNNLRLQDSKLSQSNRQKYQKSNEYWKTTPLQYSYDLEGV
jgi:hypothetical protein